MLKRRSPAFSLIAVLVIAMAGMALMGGIMYTFQAYSGNSRIVASSSFEYNLLQDGVEQGKAFLKERMSHRTAPLTWDESKAEITRLEDLLIFDGDKIGHITSRSVKGNGLNGSLDVYIYDMQYPADRVKEASMSDSDKRGLPPRVEVKAGTPVADGGVVDVGDEAAGTAGGTSLSARAYLVRATFKNRDDGETKSIETAVVQSVGLK